MNLIQRCVRCRETLLMGEHVRCERCKTVRSLMYTAIAIVGGLIAIYILAGCQSREEYLREYKAKHYQEPK